MKKPEPETRKFDLNIEKILEDWEVHDALREIIANAMDEGLLTHDERLEITKDREGRWHVRDYGRGVPLGKALDVASKMNTGAKYDSKAFKKSVGLNGVGIKAVNPLSSFFRIQSFRDGQTKQIDFCRGVVTDNLPQNTSGEANGTLIEFMPDGHIFPSYAYQDNFV